MRPFNKIVNGASAAFGYLTAPPFIRSSNKIQAKESLAGSPRGALAGFGVSNEDEVIEKKGIEGYRAMARDPEITADTDLRLVGMMPGAQITPPDSSEEGKRAAEFVEAVITRMSGSIIDVFRDQMLREAIETGFFITEPVQAKIDLPSFGGSVIGLSSLKVRPSENFNDGIHQDKHGNIEYFEQSGYSGTNPKATLDDVIYYAFRGRPWNPYGRSIYYSAYDWWYAKKTLLRLYMIFATVNASGIRELEIPDDLFKQDSAAGMSMLRKMGEYASIVRKKSQKLTIHIPPGTAGYHFIRGIRELANAEIRKAILYDETINASSQTGILSDNKEVAQSNVYGSMLAQGKAYCESIAEQLFRRILDWNGFHSWPTPLLIPEPIIKQNVDPIPIIDSLVTGWQSGFFTDADVPAELRQQLVRQAVRPMGIDHEDKAAEPDEKEGQRKKDEDVKAVQFAGAPPGRRRSDILKLKVEAKKAEVNGAENLTEAWQDNLPALKKKLNSALFDAAGKWKTKDYSAVRKTVEDNITSGGSKIRKVLTDDLIDRYKTGQDNAANIIPVRAAVSVVPVMVSPVQAQKMLAQHVYLTMGDTYKSLTNEIYYALENAIKGGISEREAMAQINKILADGGFTPGRATTIVNTSMSQAYNQGRMELFNQLSDPDGQVPGGIIGYQFSAVMDDATTELCQEYDSQFFHVDDPSMPDPPLHYGCRSVLLPVFTGEEPWDGGEWTDLSTSKSMSSNIPDGFGGN